MTCNWGRVKRRRVENISIFIAATDDDGFPRRRERGEFNFNRRKIYVIANIIPLDGIIPHLSPVIPQR